MNCWEFKQCGKEYQCPAGTFSEANGYLDGKNGGKACAYVTGTFCNKSIQGTYKDKEKNCAACDFYVSLKRAYGSDFSVMRFTQYIRGTSTDDKIIKYFPLVKS